MTDQVTVPGAANTQSPEEVQRLLAVADGTASPEPQKPELILGKFKTHDDLAKAYVELQKKLGQRAETPPVETPPADTPKDPPKEQPDPLKIEPAKEPEQKTPVDFAKFNDHFAQHGTLSDEHFAELEKGGYPKAIVDVYLNGLRSMQQSATDAVYQQAGGKESYDAMRQWALTNMTKEEIDAFNSAVTGSSKEQRNMAITALKSRYAATQENGLLSGKAAASSTAGYASWDQVTAAMSDKRYGKDPAYTAEVQNRVAASKLS